ncbi:MAG: hypothetical protein L6V81_03680 [Clostridium sp.]|nr:MAG: hypothetical protein L6V81_03680 [Clostridium sp.]
MKLESLWANKSSKQLEYAVNLATLFNSGELNMKDIFLIEVLLVKECSCYFLCCKEYQDVIDICISNIKRWYD